VTRERGGVPDLETDPLASEETHFGQARSGEVGFSGDQRRPLSPGLPHDPIVDHEWCDGCNVLLRRTFIKIADLPLGPRDADELVETIRRVAGEIEAAS